MKRSPQKNQQKKPQQVRIIAGQWRRTPLPVPDIDGLRPTPDRVRETVFNWISHLIGNDWASQNCLDLFAGSGALGFEAASRGAVHVTLIESAPSALRQLEANKEKLRAAQVVVMRGDALTIAARMAAGGQQCSLIFLDPPYRQGWLPKMLPTCQRLLAEEGLIYVETEEALERLQEKDDSPWLAGWQIVRADRAGAVFYYLLGRDKSPNIEA